jgi:hypothetical protein
MKARKLGSHEGAHRTIVCDDDVDTSGTMPDETSETSSDATLVFVPTLRRGHVPARPLDSYPACRQEPKPRCIFDYHRTRRGRFHGLLPSEQTARETSEGRQAARREEKMEQRTPNPRMARPAWSGVRMAEECKALGFRTVWTISRGSERQETPNRGK